MRYGVTGFFAVQVLYFVASPACRWASRCCSSSPRPCSSRCGSVSGEAAPSAPAFGAGLALSLVGLACVAEVWGGNLKLDGTGVAAGLAAAVPLAATSVGMIGMIEPVLASAVAWITLGASECWTLRLCTDMPVQRRSVCGLNAAQLAGGAVLLLGVALAETARLAVGQNGPHARGESDPAADTAAPQRDSSPAAA